MDNETKQSTSVDKLTIRQSFIELTQAMIETAAQNPRDFASKPDTMRELRESVRLIMGN